MLFEVNNASFLCTGRSPAVVHAPNPKVQFSQRHVGFHVLISVTLSITTQALELVDLPYIFKGPLPQAEPDECRIACNPEGPEQEDNINPESKPKP